MVIRTKTAIIIIVAAFFLFFSMAAYLISRLMLEMKQPGPANSTYVSAHCVPGK